MTYQTAVFDLDGTLLNTLEDLADAVNYSLKKNKMPLCTITQVCQYVGNGIVKLMERAVPSGKDNPGMAELHKGCTFTKTWIGDNTERKCSKSSAIGRTLF